MNRAEQRRQRRLARKNQRSESATGQPTGQSAGKALHFAVQHHTAGRLPEAVAGYLEALAIEPDHAEAHYNLASAFQDLGQLDDAVASYLKALTIRPDLVEAHNNLGLTFQGLGKPQDAVASYLKALAIEPDYAGAHCNLGNVFQDLGQLDEAVASYLKAIAIEPGFPEAHCNLGNALQELGKLEDAVASYLKALAINPEFAEAHTNLGNALQNLGKLEDAVASFLKALAIQPNYAGAHYNLGNALKELGRAEDAFAHYRRAIALNPENDMHWTGFAASLETLSLLSADDELRQDLLHLLKRPTVDLTRITRPVVSACRHHPDFLQALALSGAEKPVDDLALADVVERLSLMPLFLRIIGLSPINDLEIERLLTFLRRAMMEQTATGKTHGLPFAAALALHCFTNEYVFPETDEEAASLEHIQQQIAALLEKDRDVPASLVAALGAYRPLYCFPWAQALAERAWSGDIKEVIARQILQPRKEQSLRAQIPCLTAIRDSVSHSVRQQYEENPYPRWIKTYVRDKARTIGTALWGKPLRLDLGDYVSPENPEILVAGCGTGQHALNTASRFSNAQVLAVDLSLNSLSYALRKTGELGVSTIEYAQADIMELATLERRFDLIDCSGVLHHLGEPLAGWRVLVDLLRPHGLMKIGLYSETARQAVVSARSLIAEKGYTTSAKDIRRCRQDIIAMAVDGNPEMAKICNSGDFFSSSDCRDLLFHIQEHRFTLPQIEAALKTFKLSFLGFELHDQIALKAFQKSHPKKQALASLSLWHEFELANPDTFQGMYQFWCKKI